MYLPLLLGLLSFVLCIIFTPVCRVIALRLNLVDKPDEARKLHRTPTPRVGGLAIVLAYASALGLMLLIPPSNEHLHIQHYALLRVLLPPATLIFLVGLLDDLFTLSALQKLAGQVFACVTAAVLGHLYAPDSFTFGTPGSVLSHPLVSVSICTFWLVLCTNAINLIDGMDGLASGIGLLGTIATLMIGIYTHNAGLVIATVPLAGALLAFLFYNFNPASIFLGDCGSLTIGFMLGAICLTWQHHGGGMALGMFGPITVLALPLLDVTLAMGRRFLRRAPIFSADRGHIHHIIQDRGFAPKTAALVLYAVCTVAAILSVIARLSPHIFHVARIGVSVVLLLTAIRYLDYVEFRAIGKVFSSTNMRRRVHEEIYLRELELALTQLGDLDDCWRLVQKTCADLKFATVEMYFQTLYFDAVLDDETHPKDWWMTIPLGAHGYLRVSRSDLLQTEHLVMPALDRLHRGLGKWERHHGTDHAANLKKAA